MILTSGTSEKNLDFINSRSDFMSMYDNSIKDDLYDEIVWFLNNYRDEEPIVALLKIVTKAIEERVAENG